MSLDFEAIRARAHIAAGAAAVMPTTLATEAIAATADAVPALIAEIEHLRQRDTNPILGSRSQHCPAHGTHPHPHGWTCLDCAVCHSAGIHRSSDG